jgi:hypothetical protein
MKLWIIVVVALAGAWIGFWVTSTGLLVYSSE